MTKEKTEKLIYELLQKNEVFLFEPSFSTFGSPTVCLRVKERELSVFPGYYQKYFKAHLMETGYIPFAIPYENETERDLTKRFFEWMESISVIRQNVLGELKKFNPKKFGKLKTLPKGFV